MPRLRPAASLALVLAAAAAPAAEPARIAFLGLRPTEAATLAGTALTQLPEAQRLRAVAEEAVKTVTGAPLLRHDDLRAALAPTYLADLFECRGEASCQLRVAAPLEGRGVASAVAGDYHAAPDGFRIRLRRFDLVNARLVDEATFVLPRAEVESPSPWRAVLGPLFQDTGAIRIVTNVTDAACTLDGRACRPTPDGLLPRIPAGEHLLELAKDGYRRAHRAVVVKRREEVRVAVPLEELAPGEAKAPSPGEAKAPAAAAPAPAGAPARTGP